MGIIEDKKKLKLDALLDSAFSLFITKGIEKTSVSDITKKAKVAKGTFYLYFKNKYDYTETFSIHYVMYKLLLRFCEVMYT